MKTAEECFKEAREIQDNYLPRMIQTEIEDAINEATAQGRFSIVFHIDNRVSEDVVNGYIKNLEDNGFKVTLLKKTLPFWMERYPRFTLDIDWYGRGQWN